MDWLASITRKRCDSAFAKSRNACRVRRWKSFPADSMRSSSCCSRACDCTGSRSSRYVRFGNKPLVAHILKLRISSAVNSRPPAWYAREESRYRSVITTAPRSSAGRITSATCWARSAANSNASARGAISTSEPSTPPSSSLRIATPSTVPPGSRVTTHSRPCASTYARNRSTCVVLPTPSMPSKEMNMPCIFITVPCGVRNATAAHCYGQPTGLSVLKGDEYALHIHHRAGTTAGRAYPSLAASHSTSAFTVVGVEPISLAIRVLAQPLSANSRTLARRSARA